MNTFSPHISFSDLADLAEERTTATSSEAQAHLAICPTCTSELESIKKTISLMRSDTVEDAPEPLIEQAREFFRAGVVGVGTGREPSLMRRVIAVLTFDSLTAAPAFGLRSQANAGRQLIYSAETADIEVRVSRNNEEWQISGQVLGSDCTSGDVDLESDHFTVTAKL